MNTCINPNCNKVYTKNTKTCSRKCADEVKKINSHEKRVCVNCSDLFVVKKKQLNKLCSDECRKEWAAKPENKQDRIEKSKIAVREKFGVESVLELKEIRDKCQQTKKNRYGDENYNNVEKSLNTKLKTYGSKGYNNQKKAKETKLEKYNDENFNNREKATKTIIEKYGATHVMKLNEFQNKIINTNNEKYGVSYPMQNTDIKQKQEATNLERYGHKNIASSIVTKKKITETWRKKVSITAAQNLADSLPLFGLKLLDTFSGITNPSYETELNTNIEYEFQCLNCTNQFIATFANYTIPVCRQCVPFNKSSKTQLVIRNFLDKYKIKYVENDRRTINGYELDFFLSQHNLAIEVNGNYFHSERIGGKDKIYHISKTEACYKNGIRLLHLFEDEIINKQNIVFSRLKNILNIQDSYDEIVYARKCTIGPVNISDANEFLKLNHIQGKDKSSVKIGLFYNSKLISVMTFSKIRLALGNKKNLNNENDWELVRFCGACNTRIPGAFQKLLRNFIANFKPKRIITFADIRFSGLDWTNTVYNKSGFQFIAQTKPNYWYFSAGNYLKRYHRFSFRKQKVIQMAEHQNLQIKNNLTEWEIAQMLKMDRIWDCGSLKFELNII